MSADSNQNIDLKYVHFKKNVLDPLSPTICAAKWLDATIWLYSGLTASCHHPPNHAISVDEVSANPATLHNTFTKKIARQQMQNGERPAECEYCWKIEDLTQDHISDRVFHSIPFHPDEIADLKKLNYLENMNPKRIEIAFSRICQFACTYCNPSFSTTWVNDIQKYGPYLGLTTDKNNYDHTHDNSDPYFGQATNPFLEAFWKWWPDLKKSLQQIRVTGGEPLLSPHFWRLIEYLKKDSLGYIQLAINTNLGSRPHVIEQLAEASHHFANLIVYTSCEAFGKQAEYIRDGLDFDLWKRNILSLRNNGNVKTINIMMTINNLCLFSITDLLNLILEWKAEYGRYSFTFSMNIVRWPTFHSVLVLPPDLRKKLTQQLKEWSFEKFDKKLISHFENEHIQRLIHYLENATEATTGAAPREYLEKDLKRFILQYDKRRKKNHKEVFGADLSKWIDSI